MVEPPCGKMAALLAAVSFSHLGQAPQQIPYPEFAYYASKSQVVDSVMRKKFLSSAARMAPRTMGGTSSYVVISRYSEAISMNGRPLTS